MISHDDECDLCNYVNDIPDDDILNRTITIDEILNVIKLLPNGKSGGSDGMLYEMLNHGSDLLIEYLHALFNNILDRGHFPDM